MPRLIQVIESEEKRGCGITFCDREWDHARKRHEHSELRTVTFWHTTEGVLIGEIDPTATETRDSLQIDNLKQALRDGLNQVRREERSYRAGFADGYRSCQTGHVFEVPETEPHSMLEWIKVAEGLLRD